MARVFEIQLIMKNIRHSLFAVTLLFPGVLSAHDGTEPAGHFSQVVTEPDTKTWTGDGDYKFSTTPDWGAPPTGKAPGPTHGGVVRDKAGNVYVGTDTKGILIFDGSGKYQKS